MRAAPAWAEPFVGLRFAERGRGPEAFDCWGLVREVLARRRGAELPAWDDYETTKDGARISGLVAAARDSFVQVDEPSECDLVLLKSMGMECHVGVVLAPPLFLHTLEGLGSVIETWNSVKWRRRVEGFYRWAA